jgi:energy-coupling factor transporter ATP-binding protein EcfA2
MEIQFNSNLFVNGLEVKGSLILKDGLNVLTGSNGLGKSTVFNYIKNNRAEFFLDKNLSFMDQFPLMPLSELRVKDVFKILKDDIPFFDNEKLDHLITHFNFEHLLSRSVQLLSGGENQILKFILTSSQKTKYYFFDEPLQYLDGDNLVKIIEQIKELSESSTIILIEHRKEHLTELNANWIYMTKNIDSILIGDEDGV